MKKHIRILSVILALSLCVSMAACSSDDKAFEEADALLAAGDYDGAIAAFSAIGRYEEISAKIAEAEKLRNEANMGFLFGTWKDLSSDQTLTLREDSTYMLVAGAETWTGTYTYENNVVTISQPIVLSFELVNDEDITHLVCSAIGNFVHETNYDALCAKEIEITMDNWQEYFELKEVNNVYVNEFGEVSSVCPSIGIFLKEEYYSRLPDNYWDMELSFELIYDEASYKVLNCTPDEYDYNFDGNYEIEPVNPPQWWKMETGCTVIGNVYDQRNTTHLSEQSPYFKTVSAEMPMWCDSASEGNTQYITRWTNVQVSRVIGTLKLFPA